MAEFVYGDIMPAIRAAEAKYYRLVLLLGKQCSQTSDALRLLAQRAGGSVINVSLVLAHELLELTAKQRSLQLPAVLDKLVAQSQSPVVLDNLAILFDKDLQQDPLRVLQSVSRNHTVVASWNGALEGGRLVYAEPGHPEYRSYNSIDAVIVDMNGRASSHG